MSQSQGCEADQQIQRPEREKKIITLGRNQSWLEGIKNTYIVRKKGQSFCAKRVSLLNKIKSRTSNSPETKTAVQSSQLIRL